MVANVAILGFFKYCDFFVESTRQLFINVGCGDPGWTVLGIILPAGISFYTFQAMSYTVDIYRQECEPTDNFTDFALFVCFFPHLVAGPIMRAHTLLPQVTNPRTFHYRQLTDGFYLILIGLFKKVVLADNLAPIADDLFFAFADDQANSRNLISVVVGLYAFAWQIYGDFAGYSAIARGISKWLGFELVINFDQPYLSTTPSEFWRRWHISLSTWLRDYLYIPLGGNRGSSGRTYLNLFITMLLGGFWHGASWTFVVWGAYHGFLLSVFRFFGVRDSHPKRSFSSWIWYLFSVFIMFHLTLFGWLLFRADSFQSIIAILSTVCHDDRFSVSVYNHGAISLILIYASPVLILDLITSGERRLARVTDGSILLQAVVYSFIVIMIMFFQAEKPGAFIYFQF